jgi:hypothetical protein
LVWHADQYAIAEGSPNQARSLLYQDEFDWPVKNGPDDSGPGLMSLSHSRKRRETMLFSLWQPTAAARATRQKAPFRVEQLSPRIMLSDISTGDPEPILPPPDPSDYPPPADTGNGGN